MKIEIISGSARTSSVTRRVAKYLHRYLSDNTGHEIGFLDLQEWNLPAVQTVFTSVENTPTEYRTLSERIFGADAFILVSPEYNGSYSPAMKNLLDHFPKQHRKPIGIVAASPGAHGGLRAAMQMQQLASALFAIASPYMLLVPAVDKKFDEKGNLVDQSFSHTIHNFVTEYLWLAGSLVRSEIPSLN